MHVVQPLYYSCLEQASVGAQGHTTSTAAKMHVIQPLYYSCFERAGVGAQGHTPYTAANISAEKSVTKRCFIRKYFCCCCFHLCSHQGVCPCAYVFPVTQKQLYSYIVICAIVLPSKSKTKMEILHLPGVNGTFAIRKHGLKTEQNTSAPAK